MSGKAVAVTVIEFSVTAVFQENRCCARHSSSAAEISVALSQLYLLSLPQLIPFRFYRTSCHVERAAAPSTACSEFVTSSEPGSIRAPVELFIGTAELSQSSPPNISTALPFSSALFSSSATTKIAVSFHVYPTEKRNQEAMPAIQTQACLSDKL